MTAAAARPAARGGGTGGGSAKPSPFALTPQVTLHDRANLVALPVVGGLVLVGLLGYCDTLLVRQKGHGHWLVLFAVVPRVPGSSR